MAVRLFVSVAAIFGPVIAFLASAVRQNADGALALTLMALFCVWTIGALFVFRPRPGSEEFVEESAVDSAISLKRAA